MQLSAMNPDAPHGLEPLVALYNYYCYYYYNYYYYYYYYYDYDYDYVD